MAGGVAHMVWSIALVNQGGLVEEASIGYTWKDESICPGRGRRPSGTNRMLV